jgi:hypothetical protein
VSQDGDTSSRNTDRYSLSEMNKKNLNKKEWVVSKDDVGRATLKWNVDATETAEVQEDTDPLAQTYNFLRRLELPNLSLEGEYGEEENNPYNSGVFSANPFRSKP